MPTINHKHEEYEEYMQKALNVAEAYEAGRIVINEWESEFIENLVDWFADEKPITINQQEKIFEVYGKYM